MKLTANQIQYLSEKILNAWKSQNVVTFKVEEKQVLQRIVDALKVDYQRENDLEQEVNKMLADLERSHPGEFQRSKMFGMLKQKLAKEKRIVL